MPLEGHAERLATPLSGRERGLLAALGTAAALAAVGVGIYAATDGSARRAGCIDVTVPASVGGATIHRCGKDAARFCRTQGLTDDAIAAACRRESLVTG